ncbi:LOW QUALITY PROTEIN: uncharacterized protein LOC135113698 [Scylla paramamosain]|uniref:LOW QUALITY PROTEIN: uncharacterized protein LOC135113698 n=1 Tax=Scylla paramamosain TaxID=85552 RepID=UPI003083234C
MDGNVSAADEALQQQEEEEQTQQQVQQQEERQQNIEQQQKRPHEKGEQEQEQKQERDEEEQEHQQHQHQQQQSPIHNNATTGVPQITLAEGNESLPEDETLGRRFFGLLDPSLKVNLEGVKEEDLKTIQDIMHSVSQGVDSSFQPTNEDFWDVMRVLRLLKTHRWLTPDSVVHPNVGELETIFTHLPKQLEQHLRNMTRNEEEEEEEEEQQKGDDTTERRQEEGRGMKGSLWPLQVDPSHLEHLMANVFSGTRNPVTDIYGKLAAVVYITKTFESLGLMVAEHVFSAAEYLLWYSQAIEGINVVGVLPGRHWGTAADEPLVVGAHLDTVPDTPGLDDNGSGLASMLEVARTLTSSGCDFDFSVFFVAFDLEEIGMQGSLMFIKDFLAKTVMDQFGITKLTGAIILDCVANWDPRPQSQEFPDSWQNLLPDATLSVSSRNYTGDFAAIIFRSEVDSHLAERLERHYRTRGDQYRLELLKITRLGKTLPHVDYIYYHLNFLRSDHLRFWYLNDSAVPFTIPAVLVTDMGPYRGRMRECYHSHCDGPMDSGVVDLGFLTKVTQAVVWTVADLTKGRCGPGGRLSVSTLFSIMGKPQASDQERSLPLSTVKDTLDFLHFLGLMQPPPPHA